MENTITEILANGAVQKSLIALMEYLEEILAEKKALNSTEISHQKADFSNVVFRGTIEAAGTDVGPSIPAIGS